MLLAAQSEIGPTVLIFIFFRVSEFQSTVLIFIFQCFKTHENTLKTAIFVPQPPKIFACGGLNFAENVKYCINISQNLSEFQSTVLMRRGLLIVIGR